MRVGETCRLNDVRARLGVTLREWRTRQHLTQEQLAERSGLSYKFIGEIERGRGNPTIETMARLCDALGLGMSELFEGFDRERASGKEYRISKRELQVVSEAAASIGALVDHLTSPRYRTKRRKHP